MHKSFLDIKVGDKVIVFDEYSHDYEEHILEVNSIEYDSEWANVNETVYPFDEHRTYPMQKIEQKLYFKRY